MDGCERCGEPLNQGSRFCSHLCSSLGQRKAVPDIDCAVCGKRLRREQAIKEGAKVCGAVCQGKAKRRATYPGVCARCRKPYTAPRPGRKFCGRACSDRGKGKSGVKTVHTGECAQCGKEFTAPVAYRKYCGKGCAVAAATHPVDTILCLYCSSPFTARRNPVRPRRYCSVQCSDLSQRAETLKDGPGFYSTHQWLALRRQVLKRENGTCARCGKANRKGMAVHHAACTVAHPELRLDPDNCILLCGGCHRWVHSAANRQGLFLRD